MQLVRTKVPLHQVHAAARTHTSHSSAFTRHRVAASVIVNEAKRLDIYSHQVTRQEIERDIYAVSI